MNIQYISLTGADNQVDIKQLEKITEENPKVEWAILMFPEREGKERNPTKPWREELYRAKLPQKALHLCGSSINLLAQENSQLMEEIEQYNRIQINLKPQWASEELVEKLVKVVEKNSHKQFITQHNEANESYYQFWDNVKNHAYLFDGSLGKGKSPDNWLAPVKNKFCGYAGGLSPDNLMTQLIKIGHIAEKQDVWIDMETGIRTNDQFDLIKAKTILELVKQYESRLFMSGF